MAQFFVEGDPAAQPRPRFNRRNGRVYNPDSANAWKEAIAWQAKKYVPREKLLGPVRVWWDAYFQRPKDMMGRNWDDEPIEHWKKPDRDNIDKAILDTRTNLGFIHDDGQVCGGELRMFYTAKPSYQYHTRSGLWISIEHKPDFVAKHPKIFTKGGDTDDHKKNGSKKEPSQEEGSSKASTSKKEVTST
jgi:Holliday junction resolvase RusA-like endonuclease